MRDLHVYTTKNILDFLCDSALGYMVLSEEEVQEYSNELQKRMDEMSKENEGKNARAIYRIQNR